MCLIKNIAGMILLLPLSFNLLSTPSMFDCITAQEFDDVEPLTNKK